MGDIVAYCCVNAFYDVMCKCIMRPGIVCKRRRNAACGMRHAQPHITKLNKNNHSHLSYPSQPQASRNVQYSQCPNSHR